MWRGRANWTVLVDTCLTSGPSARPNRQIPSSLAQSQAQHFPASPSITCLSPTGSTSSATHRMTNANLHLVQYSTNNSSKHTILQHDEVHPAISLRISAVIVRLPEDPSLAASVEVDRVDVCQQMEFERMDRKALYDFHLGAQSQRRLA